MSVLNIVFTLGGSLSEVADIPHNWIFFSSPGSMLGCSIVKKVHNLSTLASRAECLHLSAGDGRQRQQNSLTRMTLWNVTGNTGTILPLTTHWSDKNCQEDHNLCHCNVLVFTCQTGLSWKSCFTLWLIQLTLPLQCFRASSCVSLCPLLRKGNVAFLKTILELLQVYRLQELKIFEWSHVCVSVWKTVVIVWLCSFVIKRSHLGKTSKIADLASQVMFVMYLFFLLSLSSFNPSLHLNQDTYGSIRSRPRCSFHGVHRLWEWPG